MLRVQGTNTVADIQSLIEAKAGWQLPPDAVLSSGQHRDLPEKSATLDELGIGDCSVVVLSPRVRGGGCAPSTEKPKPEVVFLDVGSEREAPIDAVSHTGMRAAPFFKSYGHAPLRHRKERGYIQTHCAAPLPLGGGAALVVCSSL